MHVKAGLDDRVNYTEKAFFTKNRCMFLKGTKYTLQEKQKTLGEDSQKSVSTSEAPWRETELSEGHKHPS